MQALPADWSDMNDNVKPSARLTANIAGGGIVWTVDVQAEWPSGWMVQVRRSDQVPLVREYVCPTLGAAKDIWAEQVAEIADSLELKARQAVPAGTRIVKLSDEPLPELDR